MPNLNIIAIAVVLLILSSKIGIDGCVFETSGECTNRGECDSGGVCNCIVGFVGTDCEHTVDWQANAIIFSTQEIGDAFSFTLTVEAVPSYTVQAPKLKAGGVLCTGYTIVPGAVQAGGGLQWILSSSLGTLLCGTPYAGTGSHPMVYTGAELSQEIVYGTNPSALVVTTKWPVTILYEDATSAATATTMSPITVIEPGISVNTTCPTTLSLYAAADTAYTTPLALNPTFLYNELFGVCISRASAAGYVAVTDATFTETGGVASAIVYSIYNLALIDYALGATCFQIAMPGNPSIIAVVVHGRCQLTTPAAISPTVLGFRRAAVSPADTQASTPVSVSAGSSSAEMSSAMIAVVVLSVLLGVVITGVVVCLYAKLSKPIAAAQGQGPVPTPTPARVLAPAPALLDSRV